MMGGPEAPAPCESCDGRGEVRARVTRDMAMDAGDIEMEGQEIASASCPHCCGTGQRLVAGEESGQLCAHCGGDGSCSRVGADAGGVNCSDPQIECPHCLGTGVQP
jgi:hypothetical protein